MITMVITMVIGMITLDGQSCWIDSFFVRTKERLLVLLSCLPSLVLPLYLSLLPCTVSSCPSMFYCTTPGYPGGSPWPRSSQSGTPCDPRNSKSGHQLIRNTQAGILSLSPG